jgi:hypothetical protein
VTVLPGLRDLEELLAPAGVRVALGWSDSGNEELRLYGLVHDKLLARIEALDGFVAVEVVRSSRRKSSSKPLLAATSYSEASTERLVAERKTLTNRISGVRSRGKDEKRVKDLERRRRAVNKELQRRG